MFAMFLTVVGAASAAFYLILKKMTPIEAPRPRTEEEKMFAPEGKRVAISWETMPDGSQRPVVEEII